MVSTKERDALMGSVGSMPIESMGGNVKTVQELRRSGKTGFMPDKFADMGWEQLLRENEQITKSVATLTQAISQLPPRKRRS